MKLKTKDQLGFKYFVVKKDDTQDFWDFIEWLNNEFGSVYVGNQGPFYGFEGGNTSSGTNCHYIITSFINNPKLFTAKEFMDLLRVDETLYLEDGICAKFTTNKVGELFNKAKLAGFKTLFNYNHGECYLRYSEFDGLVPCENPAEIIERISPEEFELRLNNTINKMKENKKIIGYKAPYGLFGGIIPKGTIFVKGSNNVTNSIYIPVINGIHKGDYILAKEIVEQWEPVYQEIEESYDMGSFKLRITSDGIFHSNEKITEFVRELTMNYSFTSAALFQGYQVHRKDVIFSKTGCENSETKLSQWVEVWNKYQNLKN